MERERAINDNYRRAIIPGGFGHGHGHHKV